MGTWGPSPFSKASVPHNLWGWQPALFFLCWCPSALWSSDLCFQKVSDHALLLNQINTDVSEFSSASKQATALHSSWFQPRLKAVSLLTNLHQAPCWTPNFFSETAACIDWKRMWLGSYSHVHLWEVIHRLQGCFSPPPRHFPHEEVFCWALKLEALSLWNPGVFKFCWHTASIINKQQWSNLQICGVIYKYTISVTEAPLQSSAMAKKQTLNTSATFWASFFIELHSGFKATQ